MARTEMQMSELEFLCRQIKTDGDTISGQALKYLMKLAKDWGVDVTNIAWLQMKPYPMQGALYQMLKKKCDKEGLIVKSMTVKALQRATPTDKRAGFEADIVLFNQRGFDELVKGATLDKLSIEILTKAQDIMTHPYHEEGWASLETVKAPAMQNPDYLNHMAATRGLDRTLRMIVRCETTAASELPSGQPGELLAGLPGLESPPVEAKEAAPTLKPFGGTPKAEETAPAAPATSKPEKSISQKPIKKIEESAAAKPGAKEGKISPKQVNLANLQWEGYCKTAAPSLQKEEIEGKRAKLVRALYEKDSVGDLTVAQLEEWVGMMARKEIDIVPDGTVPPEKVEIKT